MGSLDITQLLLNKAMSGAVERQQLLTQNVANAETPDYQRSDLDFLTPLREALAAGDPQTALQNVTFTPQTDSSGAISLNGNNVNIDAEMARVSENSSDYQALVELTRARLHMLSSAIGLGH